MREAEGSHWRGQRAVRRCRRERHPYTEIGIRRLACTRYGQPASFSWSACANGNRYVPLCDECDVKLNELALRFMRIPQAEVLLAAYRDKRLRPLAK
jgi:hypothetical protein